MSKLSTKVKCLNLVTKYRGQVGNGKVLYTSTGDELAAMPAYMKLISQLNDRVKLPYAEFILSLYPGESTFPFPSLTLESWYSIFRLMDRWDEKEGCISAIITISG